MNNSEKRILVATQGFNSDAGHVIKGTLFFEESMYSLPEPYELLASKNYEASMSDYYEDITEVFLANRIEELENKVDKLKKRLG